MLTILGLMTTFGGLFLFFWYRTVVALPVREQPPFIHPALFKWGIPVVSLTLFVPGLFLLSSIKLWLAGAALALAILLALLLIKFDRYSANMRLIHDRYCRIREANPTMEEMEVLFHTAQWRHPQWSQERVLELVAGKNIESLILLMVVNENKVSPISDWELYRSLKFKAARIAHK